MDERHAQALRTIRAALDHQHDDGPVYCCDQWMQAVTPDAVSLLLEALDDCSNPTPKENH